MKKWKKIILGFVLTIFVIITLLIGIFIYITKFKLKDISQHINEDKGYCVIFQQIGEPDFPFGATSVKVTLFDKNNKKIETVKKKIFDDGATASENKIKVEWLEDYVQITLMGSEQNDSITKMHY